ncbi:MAG: DUF418 domain-containing protein [bacterium]|nr:DUF418 domain-containing protein [bacterium]
MTGKDDVSLIGPVSAGERILSLDVLRGFALLGILAVNMQLFAMIFAAMVNPTVYGDLTGLNYWVAFFTYVLAEHKFMTLFSLLFGAGILLMTRKIEEKGAKPAKRHYLRMLWLFVIGMMHAYLLWYGDILVGYALCGLLVYLFRKMSPRKLLIIGLIAVCVASLIFALLAWSMPHWPQEVLEGNRQFWHPSQESIDAQAAAHLGGWEEQIRHRVPLAINMQTQIFLLMTFWRAGGLMLIGMALFKWGLLSGLGELKKMYWKFLLIGGSVGLAVCITGWISNFRHGWDYKYSMFSGIQFNYWGSLFLAAGFIGAVMLLCVSGKFSFFTRPLAAAGRMAFTNYLVQTIICTFIFYGHGFGLFGKLERIWQALIVFAIFFFQLWVSKWWLKRFRFGPVEWLWRSLTYWKIQPMRIGVEG